MNNDCLFCRIIAGQIPGAIVHQDDTLVAFKDINPDYVIPMHCSGMNMIMAVHTAMPKTLVMPSTGTRVVFGA